MADEGQRNADAKYLVRQTEALEKIAMAMEGIDGKLNMIIVKLDWLAKIQGSPRP